MLGLNPLDSKIKEIHLKHAQWFLCKTEIFKLFFQSEFLSVWVYRSGEFYEDCPIVIYEYQKGRYYKRLLEFYRDYSGILVTDSLQQYHLIEKKLPNVTNTNCWAHACRSFTDAVKIADKKDSKAARAHQTVS